MNYNSKKEFVKLGIGIMGKLLGDKEHAPVNLAALVCLISLICLLITMYYPPVVNADTLRQSLAGIVTLSLGYIFGKKS